MDFIPSLCGITALLVTWGVVAWELWQKHRVGRRIRTLRYELVFGVFGTVSMLIGFEVILEWLLQTPPDFERWVMAGIAMVTVSSVFLVGTPQLEIREQGL